MGVIDEIAVDLPALFEELAAEGLCDLVHFVYLDWADDGKGERTEQEVSRTNNPVPVRFESKLSSRRDESGNYESYTKSTCIFPFFHEGERLLIELTDKLKRLATESKPEAVFSIKTLSKADAYYELVVEEDVRDGKRVQGA